jgi:hypothetical protein
LTRARNVSICFALLVVLIAMAPVIAFAPVWLAPPLVTIAVALMLLLLPSLPEADILRSLAIFKPLAFAAALPAALMLLQIIPVPLGSIEHPVWRSAAAALPEITSGHVSIDLGFTLRGLFSYLSLISLAFSTCVITRNRDRAETTLFALCTITTFVAFELMVFSQFSRHAGDSQDATDSLVALDAFGAILNLAFVVRTIERNDARTSSSRTYVSTLVLGAFGVVVCLAALIVSTTYNVVIATGFGLTTLCLVVLIRRLSLGHWTAATVSVAVVVAWGGIVALRSAANPAVSPILRFVKLGTEDGGATTLRMLSDSNWAGSGVGTFQALAAIYGEAARSTGESAINTIALMTLEGGTFGLMIGFFLLAQLLVMLGRGALRRGRDSFYAACAGGSLVTAFFEAYCDTSFSYITVQMLASIIVGLGLAQTSGRQVA